MRQMDHLSWAGLHQSEYNENHATHPTEFHMTLQVTWIAIRKSSLYQLSSDWCKVLWDSQSSKYRDEANNHRNSASEFG